MAFPDRFSQGAIIAPFPPLRTPGCAFFAHREKYCHNGGMASASNYSGGHQIADE